MPHTQCATEERRKKMPRKKSHQNFGDKEWHLIPSK